jgi:uncharacterized protein
MIHASKFNICVSIPNSRCTIIVNGVSGSLDAIDAELAKHLSRETAYGTELTLSALPDRSISYLKSRGYLTIHDDAAEDRMAQKFALSLESKEARRTPLFYLMMTYECQLRCPYCFEHDTRARLRREGLLESAIRPDLIVAAFDAMDEIEAHAPNRACTLYGGEPLEADNRLVVEQVLAEGRRRGYRFMAASNGVDLQHYLHLLGPDGVAGLHVPLDGTQITHDRTRIGKHHAPTFERIVDNLVEAQRLGVRIRVRVNADRDVLDRLDELATYLEDRGFFSSPLFSCYVKAVFPTRSGKIQVGAITDADVALKLGNSPRLARIFSGYPVIHDRIDSLFGGSTSDALRPGHCGAPSGQILIFDPGGSIFPCNNVVGERRHQIGTYFPTLRWNDDVRQSWAHRTVGRMAELYSCKYALFCGGGCLYDAQVQHGSIKQKSCDCGKFSQEFENLIRASYARLFRSPFLNEADEGEIGRQDVIGGRG